MTTTFAERLLAWYAQHQRRLPWRQTRDPYAIWIAEVMLQQTRVETVIPYYQRWMQRFPGVASLAAAEQQQILQAWEGLGYYRRAHHLQQAARIIVEQFAGRFPHTAAQLRQLPGIGDYTAAAIAAIAFDADEIALDGNLRRVFARLLDLPSDPRTPEGERAVRAHAVQLLPPGQAALFNQALMDLGSLICTPRKPACQRCPLLGDCQACANATQELRPLRKARPPIPHHIVVAGVIRRRSRLLLGQRPEDGLLGGLWEFPGGKLEPGEPLGVALQRELREELGVAAQPAAQIGTYQHAYSHFRVTLHALECRLPAGEEPQALEHRQLRWVTLDELSDLPMGKIDRAIARDLTRASSSPTD